eukprot:185075_1
MDQVDLSTFKGDQNGKCNNSNWKQCKSMRRLLFALKYYSELNIDNNKDAEIFTEFMLDIYYGLINDYIHFNNEHTHQLQHINDDLITNNECKISTCTSTSRHHDTKTNKKNNLDDFMNFYKQTMDSLHFYLF